MNFFDKKKILIKAIGLECAMKNILEGAYIIQLHDIKYLDYSNIKDTFLDKVVNIGILQHDISTEAMEYLSKCIEKKKNINEFTCSSCSKPVPTRCVQCEACLLWFHFKCVGFKKADKKKIWFCSSCEE